MIHVFVSSQQPEFILSHLLDMQELTMNPATLADPNNCVMAGSYCATCSLTSCKFH